MHFKSTAFLLALTSGMVVHAAPNPIPGSIATSQFMEKRAAINHPDNEPYKGTPAFSGRAVGENDVDERDEPLLKERFPAVEGEDIPPYRTPTHHIVPQDPPAKGKNARGVVNDEGIGPVTGEGTVRDDIFPREAEANPVMGDEPGPYDDKRSAVLEDEPGPYGDK